MAAAVGLPVAAFAAHALFRLNRRWLVFVPTGWWSTTIWP